VQRHRRLIISAASVLLAGLSRLLHRSVAAGEPEGNATMSENKSEAAAFATTNPPTCISAFSLTPVERLGDIDICVRFALSCKICSSSNLRILCFPIVVTEAGKYAYIDVGQTIERNPHHVICVNCGVRHLVFDAARHGYDGELGNGTSYEQGTGEERAILCEEGDYKVDVVFTYNVELSELREIAEKENLQAQNLFDWFHIIAVSSSGEELKDINYECA
jgi:hypothetical protein